LGALLLAAAIPVCAPAQSQDPSRDQEPPVAGEGEPGTVPGTVAPLGLPGDAPADAGDRSYLATSLTVGAGRDDGLVADGAEIDDTVYTVSPSLLLLHRPSERTELALAYEPEVETFETHSELDAVEHVAGALWRFDASRRTRLIAGGSLLDGEDPGRLLGGQLLDLPRSPFQQWRAYAGWEHRWQMASVLLNVSRTSTRIDPTTGALGTGLDQTEDLASLTFDRTLGPRTGLTLSYSYLDPEIATPPPLAVPGEPGEPGDDPLEDPLEDPFDDPFLEPISDPVQTALVGLTFRPAVRLAFHVAGGALYEQGEDASFLGTAEMLRQGDAVSFRLRYDRSLLSFGPAETGGSPALPAPPTAAVRDTVSDTVTLDFAVSPGSRRVRFEQMVWGARTTLSGDDETLDSVALRSRLVVRTVRRLGLFAQYDYFDQNGSRLFGERFSRSRYSVGLIVGISGPPGAWGVRTAPETPAGLLPYRRGD
jgi:hypothetical protein